MLTLDTPLHIPAAISFASVEQDVALLNLQTNQYYLLDDVGARLWSLLKDGKLLREAYQVLLEEYAVEPARLEQDLLELLERLKEQGLVEILQA
ncbi:MAG: PqqD family protein [Anaerolineales bacterium]